MFLGIPYNSQSFGFDPHGGLGVEGIRAVIFTPATNTPYLVLFGVLPSAAAGKVDIKLWATSDKRPGLLASGGCGGKLMQGQGNKNIWIDQGIEGAGWR
jgi:hypothetical protein